MPSLTIWKSSGQLGGHGVDDDTFVASCLRSVITTLYYLSLPVDFMPHWALSCCTYVCAVPLCDVDSIAQAELHALQNYPPPPPRRGTSAQGAGRFPLENFG